MQRPDDSTSPAALGLLVIIGLVVSAVFLWAIVGAGQRDEAEEAAVVGTAAPAAASLSGGTSAVTIKNFAYNPTPLTVQPGTRVTWTQQDSVPHTVTSGVPRASNAGSIFSQSLNTVGATFTFAFTDPGTYQYFCTYHLEMVAEVVVPGPGGQISAPPTPAAPQVTATPYVPPANATILARGLTSPRGFTWGPDGALYVAEAGAIPPNTAPAPPAAATPVATPAARPTAIGGSASAAVPPGVTAPAVNCERFATLPTYDRPKECQGSGAAITSTNGRVSRIAADGTRTTVVDGLPVIVGPFQDTFGANSVAFIGNQLYVIVAAGETRGFPNYPSGVYAVAGGRATLIADMGAWVKANPPTFIPDDYNYGLFYDAVALNGKLYISDGNAQGIYEVDPAAPDGSRIRRLADLSPGHPVLTGIAAGPDGNLYVSTFTPAPYPIGGAVVHRITPAGQVSTAVTGLSVATGVAVAPDGTLYVNEFGSAPTVAPPGRIVRVRPDGTLETVASPLIYPTILRWGPDGLYSTNFSVVGETGGPPLGTISRVNLAPAQ